MRKHIFFGSFIVNLPEKKNQIKSYILETIDFTKQYNRPL